MGIKLNTALANVRRSPFQALAAVAVLSVTFFVGTLLSVLVYSSNQAINFFETRPQVIAFLINDAQPEQISTLQRKLNADSRVKELKYVSKEEALAIYKEATSDNPLLSELVSPSIFPASLEFSLTDLNFAEEVINDVKGEEIVDQVGFTASLGGEATLGAVVSRLRRITWYIRLGGGAFVGVLGLTSFLVLTIIITMKMHARSGEIEILDLIGARPGFVRVPIVLEAIIYSLLGAIVGWVMALILVLYSLPSLILYFGDIPILPRDTVELFTLFGIILASELAIGFFLGLIGSNLAVNRVRGKLWRKSRGK